MINSYLSPISKELIEFKNNLPTSSLGSNINLYDSEKSDYSLIDIAVIGINEYRNSEKVNSKFINLLLTFSEFLYSFIPITAMSINE